MAAATAKRYPHEPDYIVAPGEVLQETIDALGMTQADLAKRTGLSKKTVNQIMQGREPLSHVTALRLERVVGVSARFWNTLEATYRERLARREEKVGLSQDLEHGRLGTRKLRMILFQNRMILHIWVLGIRKSQQTIL